MLLYGQDGDKKGPGRVITPSAAPQSYIVSTSAGQAHKNCHHLTPRLETYQDPSINTDLETLHTIFRLLT